MIKGFSGHVIRSIMTNRFTLASTNQVGYYLSSRHAPLSLQKSKLCLTRKRYEYEIAALRNFGSVVHCSSPNLCYIQYLLRSIRTVPEKTAVLLVVNRLASPSKDAQRIQFFVRSTEDVTTQSATEAPEWTFMEPRHLRHMPRMMISVP